MNLREMGAIYDQDVPECVAEEPLQQHFLVDLKEFKYAVQALWFDSGPANNPSARSYVFYFYRGEINEHQRPDDIMTFKVKFSDPSRIYIIDQYLGGTAFGVVNAPPLAERGFWGPGWISEDGKRQLAAISSGQFSQIPEPTVRTFAYSPPSSPPVETKKQEIGNKENKKKSFEGYVYFAIIVVFILFLLYWAC